MHTYRLQAVFIPPISPTLSSLLPSDSNLSLTLFFIYLFFYLSLILLLREFRFGEV